MRLIDNRDVRDPYLNLALEEYCVRHLAGEGPAFLVYVNEPCVVLGKNQNPVEEIDLDRVVTRGIPVARRISGGGAVWHDPGNLNFAFLVPYRPGTPLERGRFVEPVIRALRRIGIPAEAGERSDILVEGRKVSGGAQFASVRGALGHGTLLFDANLEQLRACLDARPVGVESRAVKSVRSGVVNLREFLGKDWTMEEFRTRLVTEILAAEAPSSPVRLEEEQWSEIGDLADGKYRTWEWTYGRTPPFLVRRSGRFPGGEARATVRVRGYRVEAVELGGTWPDPVAAEALAARLRGAPYDPDRLEELLALPDQST
jgi:lipoate-protein ligase A